MPYIYNGQKDPKRIEDATAGVLPGFLPYRKKTLTYATKMLQPFVVDTLEGLHVGKAGDYLAIGSHGEMYPIDSDVFSATYDPVEGE